MEINNFPNHFMISFNDDEMEQIEKYPDLLSLLEICKINEAEIKSEFFESLSNQNISSKFAEYYLILKACDKKIYKFRDDKNHNISALKEGKLWFSCATQEDDTTECQPLIKETDEQLKKFYNILRQYEPKFKDKKYEKAIINVRDIFQPYVYICSFSEKVNNTDLWNRYANEKKGFCMEFKFGDLIEKSLYPLPVIYNKNEISIMDFIKNVKAATIVSTVLTKENDKWGTQDEWRVIEWAKTLNVEKGTKGVLVNAPKPSTIYYTPQTKNFILSELKNYAKDNDIPLLLYSDF